MEAQTQELRKTQKPVTWPEWLKSLKVDDPQPIDISALYAVRPAISKLHSLTEMRFRTQTVNKAVTVTRLV